MFINQFDSKYQTINQSIEIFINGFQQKTNACNSRDILHNNQIINAINR